MFRLLYQRNVIVYSQMFIT